MKILTILYNFEADLRVKDVEILHTDSHEYYSVKKFNETKSIFNRNCLLTDDNMCSV